VCANILIAYKSVFATMRTTQLIQITVLFFLSPALAFSTVGIRVINSSPSHHVPGKELRLTPPIKAPFHLTMSTEPAEATSDCPVERASSRLSKFLTVLDKYILKRLIRFANHGPALLSLSYFFLISMASMMGMGPLTPAADAASSAAKITLSAALTQTVGTTTNSEFAALFPTNITPASWVFLVWPVISVLQLLTVVTSAIFPSEDEFLSQSDLSSLTIANLCSSFWLLASSNAKTGSLPLASFVILPFVPLFSAYPLRNNPTYVLPAFQLFSSFTTLASFLAFTVELQHGGRVPYFGTLPAEVAGSVFLLLYSGASLAVRKKTVVKRLVNFGALSGILSRRVVGVVAASSWFWGGVGTLLSSVTFVGSVACWGWSVKELFFPAES